MSDNNILVFNCGSSSIKFMVIDPCSEVTLMSGLVEALNTGKPTITMHISDSSGKNKTEVYSNSLIDKDNYEYAIEFIIRAIDKIPEIFNSIKAVGHRVVHGGNLFSKSIIIDQRVIKNITICQDLAPLHNPVNLTGITIAQQEFPNLKHIACFDTAFHQTMPERAYLYPVPYSWYKEHKIRRYGFHGMSHKYVSLKAAEYLQVSLDKSSFITAHLGNGCSAAAILNGQSVDTTMGFTPLEGLMMGTRSGSIDPSIVFYISNKLQISNEQALELLNKQSGLLGVSELSMDMRTLEDKAIKGHKQSQLAIELFCYILAKAISSLAVSLDKIDGLIFTGGIGENSKLIRSKTIELLKVLNFKLDIDKNNNITRGNIENIASSNSRDISNNNSIPILVVPTNEELMIAKETVVLL